MLSSDKNIETLAQLIEVLKHYLGLQKEYVKLDAIDKVVRLLTVAALAILFVMLIVPIMLFVMLGIASWLSSSIGVTAAYFVVAVIHVLILILFIVFRKSWIEKPLVRFLASLLMS
jgi:hypothetical protein